MAETSVRGYVLEKEWKNSNSSMTTTAKKGGKRYFLKKYKTVVCPIKNEAMTEALYANNKKQFDNFVEARSSVNKEIRTFAASGGDIIIPVDEFVYESDIDITYVEASEWVEGNVVKDEDVIPTLERLPINARIALLITATGALRTVHSHHIVHSDLKLTNVLIVESRGSYSAKLIDFDNSYFEGKVPEYVVGDIKFYSPELGLLSNNLECEDDELLDNLRANMTTQSDIFSLGIIFHYYLSGEAPKYSGIPEEYRAKAEEDGPGSAYLWLAVGLGAKVEISPKISDPVHRSLIKAMLRLEKEKRPDANTVMKALKMKRFDDPYAEAGEESVAPAPKEEPAPTPTPRVETPRKEERPSTPSVTREAKFDEPWPEDDIDIDVDKLRARRYIGLVRATLNGKNGYYFYRDIHEEYPNFKTGKGLLEMGFAKKKVHEVKIESSICEPWPEHGIEFDIDVMKAKGFVAVERALDSNRNHVYKFLRSDGKSSTIPIGTCLLMKLVKKI